MFSKQCILNPLLTYQEFSLAIVLRALPKGVAKSLCSYCGAIETTIHLFFQCSRTVKTIQVIKPFWEL